MEGKNSEALLPLLLYFTPNLKSLDLGSIDGSIIDVGGADFIQCLGCLGLSWDQNPGDEYDGKRQRYEARRTLFFLENLYSIKRPGLVKNPLGFPPGLKNLKEFSMSCKDAFSRHLRETTLLPVLVFPCIERIQAFRNTSSTYREGYISNYDVGAEQPSTVKYLKLDTSGTGSLSKDYLSSIAKLTGNLSGVKIQRKHKFEKYMDTMEEDEEIARIFLECNNTTLHFSEVYINGGGFNDDGEYDGDGERCRTVLRKQKLFEQTRLHGWSIRPPPPFMTTSYIPYTTFPRPNWHP